MKLDGWDRALTAAAVLGVIVYPTLLGPLRDMHLRRVLEGEQSQRITRVIARFEGGSAQLVDPVSIQYLSIALSKSPAFDGHLALVGHYEATAYFSDGFSTTFRLAVCRSGNGIGIMLQRSYSPLAFLGEVDDYEVPFDGDLPQGLLSFLGELPR